ISLTVHLIVRYRELEQEEPTLDHRARLARSVSDMALPCFYTSLTTIVAFFSLVISDIPPIIDFGWMMVAGICVAFVLTFLLFPATLALLPGNRSAPPRHRLELTPALARLTLRHGKAVLLLSALLLLGSVLGMTRLHVENSFINYFDEGTEIYQGMVSIDRNMGGTTPLDVIVDLSPLATAAADSGIAPHAMEDRGFGGSAGVDDFGFGAAEEFDDFDFAGDGAAAVTAEAYWFSSDKMRLATEIHSWLEALPESGKVLSLATLLSIAYELN